MILRVLRLLAIPSLIVLAVCLAVIVYWQETERLVTPEDVGLYLVGLPVLAVAAWYAARAAVRALARRPDAPSVADRSPDAAGSGEAAADPAAGPDWRIVACGIATRLGNDPAEALAGLSSRKQSPGPDPDLRDAEGLPVRTARAEADTAALAGWIEASGRDGVFDDAGLRALAMLDSAVRSVLAETTEFAAARSHEAPRLELRVLVPAAWPSAGHEAAKALLAERAAAGGWRPDAVEVQVVPSETGVEAYLSLDAAADPDRPARLLLLAGCDSAIDEAIVARWQEEGTLYSFDRQSGRVPGEAAGAVLLREPLAEETAAVAVRIGAPSRGSHAEPLAGRAKPDPQLVAGLVRSALDARKLGAETVALVVSDADHRGTRLAETASVVGQLFPHLDPVEDALCVADGLGSLGAASAVVPLALACAACTEREAPVVVTSVNLPQRRVALVVHPAAPTMPVPGPAPA